MLIKSSQTFTVNMKLEHLIIHVYMYSELIFPFLCQVQGRSHNGLRREGVLRPEISKKGVLRVQKRCRYMPERRFVRVLVKMTKKFGPMGGGRF